MEIEEETLNDFEEEKSEGDNKSKVGKKKTILIRHLNALYLQLNSWFVFIHKNRVS